MAEVVEQKVPVFHYSYSFSNPPITDLWSAWEKESREHVDYIGKLFGSERPADEKDGAPAPGPEALPTKVQEMAQCQREMEETLERTEEENDIRLLQTKLAEVEAFVEYLRKEKGELEQEAMAEAAEQEGIAEVVEQDVPVIHYSYSFSAPPLTNGVSAMERESREQVEGYVDELLASEGTVDEKNGSPTPKVSREGGSNEQSKSGFGISLSGSPSAVSRLTWVMGGLAAWTSLIGVAIAYLLGKPGPLPSIQVAELLAVWTAFSAILWIVPGRQTNDHNLQLSMS